MSEDHLCLNIEGTSHIIICGNCDTPVDFEVPGDESSNIGCPECLTWTPKDDAIRIVKEFATAEMQLQLNRQMKDMATKSKTMTFSGQTEHDRSYRFKVTAPLD